MSAPPSDPGDGTWRPGSKRYEGAGISVSYESRLCLHQAEYIKGLPTVFDVERRPWIDAGAEPANDIAEVVRRCPSGALQYHLSGERDEEPSLPTQIQRHSDGSLHIRGDLQITTASHVRRETRVILCGCSLSTNQPFCDHGGRCAHQF
ncbi:(4Fe-4S)-binding protein [Streptomyces sp. NBC_01803]|uniref:(4Fe-4S)-binding protein n=1 Tax=Streptomyces sp. NBC_01803 TaxID=2975946 RepID=UPI002DD8AC6B|nr:(4Fe-4S)-binding protein [Streptomyces sp. NBC_01803]WSA42942.1 (4Fe-4S)-binding protein [Streptomyces sp. NBC_01803]